MPKFEDLQVKYNGEPKDDVRELVIKLISSNAPLGLINYLDRSDEYDVNDCLKIVIGSTGRGVYDIKYDYGDESCYDNGHSTTEFDVDARPVAHFMLHHYWDTWDLTDWFALTISVSTVPEHTVTIDDRAKDLCDLLVKIYNYCDGNNLEDVIDRVMSMYNPKW